MTTAEGNCKFGASISSKIAVFLLFSIEFMFHFFFFFSLLAQELSTTDGKFATKVLLRIGLNVCVSF